MDAAQALIELQAREPIFHRPELGNDYPSMVTEDFWEIGASGKVYSRDFVLSVLAERLASGHTDEPWQTSGFQCRQLSEEYFLLTYTLVQGLTRTTLRSTLWRWNAVSGWKIAFHQGTLVSA